MKAIIEIEMDNATFQGEFPNYELSQILDNIADSVRFGEVNLSKVMITPIKDSNGVTVGSFTVTEG